MNHRQVGFPYDQGAFFLRSTRHGTFMSSNWLKKIIQDRLIQVSQYLAPFAAECPSLAVKNHQNFEKQPFFGKMTNFQKSITRLLEGRQSPIFACNPGFCPIFSGQPLEQIAVHKKKFCDFFTKHSHFFLSRPMNVP